MEPTVLLLMGVAMILSIAAQAQNVGMGPY